MGDGENASLRLQFNPKVRLEFHGSTITSDAGLLAFREFDDALGLTEIAEDYLQESRTGRNILHHLVPLLRQSIYSRLAGYDDTNDAVRLSQDPAMRVIVGWQGSERKGASTSEMGRFETEFLTQEDNLQDMVEELLTLARLTERERAVTERERAYAAGVAAGSSFLRGEQPPPSGSLQPDISYSLRGNQPPSSAVVTARLGESANEPITTHISPAPGDTPITAHPMTNPSEWTCTRCGQSNLYGTPACEGCGEPRNPTAAS